VVHALSSYLIIMAKNIQFDRQRLRNLAPRSLLLVRNDFSSHKKAWRATTIYQPSWARSDEPFTTAHQSAIPLKASFLRQFSSLTTAHHSV
jgi:hypothetical protein